MPGFECGQSVVHRSARMILPLVPFRRALLLVVWALLGLGSALSCVAQEPYSGGQSSGGTAGAKGGSAGAAGFALVDPEAGAGNGGGGTSAGTSASSEAECRTSEQCASPYPYCATAL